MNSVQTPTPLGSPKLWLLVAAGAIALREVLKAWTCAAAASRTGVAFSFSDGFESRPLAMLAVVAVLLAACSPFCAFVLAISPKPWVRAALFAAMGFLAFVVLGVAWDAIRF